MRQRIRMAWHVLRGRPLMYRMVVMGGPGTEIRVQPNTLAYQNTVVNVTTVVPDELPPNVRLA